MSRPDCQREFDVVALVRAGRWPDACDDDLRRHVATCADCQEAVAIAELLLDADRGAEVDLPSAAQMWWRLAVRARLEREQAAARPVVWLQGLAAACGLGLLLAVAGRLGPGLVENAVSMAGRVSTALPQVGWPAMTLPGPLSALVLGAGGLLVLAAATTAVYLWLAED